MPADSDLLEEVARAAFPDADTIEHLGTGGFASTFKVDRGGDIAAVKIIDPTLADSERVARELAALQRVDHPNVVRFRAHGEYEHEAETYAWFEMDYVSGEPLIKILKRGDVLPLADKLKLISEAIAGARAIWDEGTAHRDLSPNNLMVTDDGNLVIVDLGLAKHYDDETVTILPTPGTPGWMSPEQVGASPTHGDWRSDQYVLGLVAFALLTGVPPFGPASPMVLWAAPANETVRPVRSLEPSVPQAVADIVAKMLDKQPHRRYLKPEVLSAELTAAMALPEEPSDAGARFHLVIGHYWNFINRAFLDELSPDGVVVQHRSQGSTSAKSQLVRDTDLHLVMDPQTHFARSPSDAKPKSFSAYPFGGTHHTDCFTDGDERRKWCAEVVDVELAHAPDAVMAPYFYAGDGEIAWINETLQCAVAARELLEEKVANEELDEAPPLWTTVAVSARWLAHQDARDRLLAAVTGQPVDVLQLLVHTTQVSFGALGDAKVLEGFADTIAVMRDAGVPVVVGRRGSCGLLLLALGADGWCFGEEANLQNMAPHPEAEASGGPAQPRVYLPELLNTVTPATLALFNSARSDPFELDTDPGKRLLLENPTLESITTEQRILLHQHNLLAVRAQAGDLATRSGGARVTRMRELVEAAAATYRKLPDPPNVGDGGGFLTAWASVL